jgi:hypothetical protein
MRMLGRGKKKRPERFAPEGLPAPPSVEDMVHDGLLLARATLRMNVKNLMFLRAIRDHEDFDEDYYVSAFHDECVAIAAEKMADAKRMDTLKEAAEGRTGRPLHPSDYRWEDAPLLDLRQQSMIALSHELVKLSSDTDAARELITEARVSALSELADAAPRDWAAPPRYVDPDYEAEHDKRVGQLKADLMELEQEVKPEY